MYPTQSLMAWKAARMLTFKSLSETINILKKGHKIIKVLGGRDDEVLITSNGSTFAVMHDNDVVGEFKTKKDAMQAAKKYSR